MIKEIVNFTKNLDKDFKDLAVKPKEGLHILLKLQLTDNVLSLNLDEIEYEVYSKKMVDESEFIKKCKFFLNRAWCIDTNKCFDLPTKAIHSCSPYMLAFKREHLAGGGKFIENAKSNKKQITERFGSYFDKAFELLDSDEDIQRCEIFKFFFLNKKFEQILESIESKFTQRRNLLHEEVDSLKLQFKESKDKTQKESYKTSIQHIEGSLQECKQLEDSDYILFYLDVPLEMYEKANSSYLSSRLFNTDRFNITPSEDGIIYGTSNFLNSFNSNMPFLMHQSASFSITGRISNVEAKCLHEFLPLLSSKILPNPLPIFLYKEELLQGKMIGLFRESGYRAGYKEIVERLFNDYKEDFGNYYLLNWVNSADGIIFRDLDFVSKFEFDYNSHIEDLFNANYSVSLKNIFDFQNEVLQVVFNNNLIVKTKDSGILQKYFDEIDPKYCKSSLNYLQIMKYRKACYDFVYKSKRSSITQEMFRDMLQISILEDIRLDEFKNNNHTEYFNIRKKLNIWFSLYEKFKSTNEDKDTMASKLKDYKQFVDDLINDRVDDSSITDEQFMFAAGQVIDYLLSKSRSADQSYRLLEPYTQKTRCKEFKKAIANDFDRYKHQNYSGNFEKVTSMVLSYDTDKNLKDYLPELLAGVFSKNQLFSTKKQETINN